MCSVAARRYCSTRYSSLVDYTGLSLFALGFGVFLGKIRVRKGRSLCKTNKTTKIVNSMSDVWSVSILALRQRWPAIVCMCASAPAFVFPLYINFISLFVYMYLYVWAVGADNIQGFFFSTFSFSFLFCFLSVIRFERWTNDGLCALEILWSGRQQCTYTGRASVRESMNMVYMCVCV